MRPRLAKTTIQTIGNVGIYPKSTTTTLRRQLVLTVGKVPCLRMHKLHNLVHVLVEDGIIVVREEVSLLDQLRAVHVAKTMMMDPQFVLCVAVPDLIRLLQNHEAGG